MISPNEAYPPCSQRTRLTKFNRDGSKAVVQRCSEKSVPTYGQDVSPEQCDACPVRAEITAVAMRTKEYKPPLFAEHFKILSRRPDADAPSYWPVCLSRDVVEAPGCCGAKVEHRLCASLDCFRLGAEVSPEICRACVHRRS